MSDVRTTFLYAAIEDAQGTIRSLDIRSGFLFVMLLSPAAVADKVFGWVTQHHAWYVFLLIAAAQISWVLALACLFAATVAISNPADHVGGGLRGTFYSGDLFTLRLKHVFFDKEVHSARDVEREFQTMPDKEEDAARELTYEKMKLTFIRDVKTLRLNSGAILTVVAGLSAIAAYGASLV